MSSLLQATTYIALTFGYLYFYVDRGFTDLRVFIYFSASFLFGVSDTNERR